MNQQKNLPIGVFDSGVGGLTVAREIMRQMPNEKIVYFGDTARVPYGNKSSKTILKYSGQIERFLLSRGVKAIAVACNTASAYALPELEKDCPVPIIGVIKPGAKTAAEITENGRIGVIGTTATISSGIYTEYIRDLMPDVMVHGRACPLFVPLVEEGLWEDPVTEEIARRYLAELMDEGIDTLILGCTHYQLIRKTQEMLGSRGLLAEERPALGSADSQYSFFVSDMADKFQQFANSIIKYGILSAKTINIEEY